jgi:transposase
MRFIETLSETERKEVSKLHKQNDSHRVRRRAHTILLSAEGFTIDEIARIYQTDRDTVSATYDRWEKVGIEGLFDSARSGRPPKLTKEEADEAVGFLKESPQSIKKALAATKKNRPGDQRMDIETPC